MSEGAELVRAYGERYRELRREIEEAVLPLATSLDGRHFTCQLSPHHLSSRTGGYVVIEHEGASRLAQLLELELESVEAPEIPAAAGEDAGQVKGLRLRVVRGAGTIRSGDGAPFHDGLLRPARPDEVRAWLDEIRPASAQLDIGELTLAKGVPFALDAGGFNRHTFLCGQSGSGKTYSLGVMLERLLLETSLRIVVLDPNSDFVRLGVARDGTDATLAERYRECAKVVVRRAADRGEDRLALRFADLDPRTQAAALQLDPVADREEYSQVISMLDGWKYGDTTSLATLFEGHPKSRPLALRLQNLGLEHWQLWSRDDAASVVEQVAARDARCLVVDLGSLRTLEEKAIVSEAVLATLWRNRADRAPTLVVIDEAHNVCPSEPQDAITAIAAEHAARIAAEGRKFGLYLLVSTQRPQKVDEQVLSQCDNLVLMRMNSAADLAYVRELFSFVPAPLLDAATDFGLGEALVGGNIASHPALIRFGARVSEEGGSDVPADWAAR